LQVYDNYLYLGRNNSQNFGYFSYVFFTLYILENNEKKLVVDKLLCVLNYVRGAFSPLAFDVLIIVHK